MGSQRKYPSLGPRGEGWVLAQFGLGVVVVITGLLGPMWPDGARPALVVAGVLVGIRGLVLFVLGIAALGASLTPYPRPSERATMRDAGIYGRVRHPIYGGAVLLALGWALAFSPLATVPTALLALLFEAKARFEESLLLQRYPEYEAYIERVGRRFLPRPF